MTEESYIIVYTMFLSQKWMKNEWKNDSGILYKTIYNDFQSKIEWKFEWRNEWRMIEE